MIFCGQCGLLVPPGQARCPRCGAAVDAEIDVKTLEAEDVHTDDPTVASSLPGYFSGAPEPNPQRLASPMPRQQKLILGPGEAPYSPQAYDPQTPSPFAQPAAFATPLPRMQDGDRQPARLQKRRGKAPLFISLLILLLLAGAGAVFVLRPAFLFGGNTITPAQQAQALVQRYYNDINQQNYRDAYNLWWNNPQHPRQTYQQFVSGYANTRHVDITFGSITPNADGTVQVDVTISATEATTTGVVKHLYQGYYIVGPKRDGWKLLQPNIQQIS